MPLPAASAWQRRAAVAPGPVPSGPHALQRSQVVQTRLGAMPSAAEGCNQIVVFASDDYDMPLADGMATPAGGEHGCMRAVSRCTLPEHLRATIDVERGAGDRARAL